MSVVMDMVFVKSFVMLKIAQGRFVTLSKLLLYCIDRLHSITVFYLAFFDAAGNKM